MHRLSTRYLVVIAVCSVALSALGVVAWPQLVAPKTVVTSSWTETCNPPPGYIVVISNGQGFNDSVTHGAPENPWPLIRVQRDDTVNLIICNTGTIQAHGFALDHYFDRGVTLRPGEAFKVSFVASQTGEFELYCNVFCTSHRFMLGRLVVT